MKNYSSSFFYFYILAFQIDFLAQWYLPHSFITFFILMAFLLSSKKKIIFNLHLMTSSILILWNYPELSNHGTLYIFSNFVLLFGNYFSKEIVFNVLRYALMIAYIWSGVHKINSGFLDPDISCANEFFNKIFDSTSKSSFIPISIIMTEILFPVLLLSFKRVVFLLPLMIFHLLTAFIDLYDFMAIAFALHLLFLKEDKPRKEIFWPLALITFVAGIGLYPSLTGSYQGIYFSYINYLFYFIYLLLYLYYFSSSLMQNINLNFKLKQLPIYLILNIHFLAPYLGVYTGGVFAMFSNLNTSYSHWNHYMIPREIHIFSKIESANHQIQFNDYRCTW